MHAISTFMVVLLANKDYTRGYKNPDRVRVVRTCRHPTARQRPLSIGIRGDGRQKMEFDFLSQRHQGTEKWLAAPKPANETRLWIFGRIV